MNIKIFQKEDAESFETAKNGSIWKVTYENQQSIVMKVHCRLYIIVGTETGIEWNPTWYDEWEDPVLLKKGDSFTVEV